MKRTRFQPPTTGPNPMTLLPIPNRRQLSHHACWIAQCQSLILWHTGTAPSQNKLAKTLGLSLSDPGTTDHAARLLAPFGFSLSDFSSRSAAAVANSLANAHPLFVIATTAHHTLHHLLLIKGLIAPPNTPPIVLINDPNLADGYSIAVPFHEFQPTWQDLVAIVPERKTPYTNNRYTNDNFDPSPKFSM